MTRILGVDPGASGAFALIDTDDVHKLIAVRDMPTITFRKNGKLRHEISEAGIVEIIEELLPIEAAWIEQVGARPGQGVSSMFKFGLSLGLVAGVLAAVKVPRLYVPPVVWKRAFRLGTDKAESRRRALGWFASAGPLLSRVKDEGRAEAALIAVFGAQEPI